MWIPINEDWGEPPPEFQAQLVRATRAADPTRLVIDASGWKQLEDTDLVDVHDYGAELTKHVGSGATTSRSGSASSADCRSAQASSSTATSTTSRPATGG